MSKKLKILICPDSFKGTLEANEVAQIIANGLLKTLPENKIQLLLHPVADGGEGFLDSIKKSIKLNTKIITTENALGKKIKATIGLTENGIGIIEMAKASGLNLIPKKNRNPFLTSTYGTGVLIKKILKDRPKKIIVGIGGSATNDGGTGMARALGVRFLDKNKRELLKDGSLSALKNLAYVDISKLDQRIKDTSILVCSDVTNKLLGKKGASYIYARQKGAQDKELSALDDLLKNLNKVVKKDLKKDMNKIIGGGAAGGLGAGLVTFLDAKIVPGLNFIAKLTKLDQKIKQADLIITGEGKMDGQTKFDKAPYAILKIAKRFNKRIYALNGYLEKAPSEFDGVYGTNSIVGFNVDEIEINSKEMLLKLSIEFAETIILKLLK